MDKKIDILTHIQTHIWRGMREAQRQKIKTLTDTQPDRTKNSPQTHTFIHILTDRH